MSQSSSEVGRGPGRVSAGRFPLGALTSAGGPDAGRLRVVETSDQSPEDETPPMLDLRLMLVTESGFGVPLVTSRAQSARLLRSSGDRSVGDQHGNGDQGPPKSRRVRRPWPVPVDQFLSRGRLFIRFETPLGGGAA